MYILFCSQLGLHNKVGWVTNRRISCYFRRDKVVSGQGSLFNDRYHLLLAKGQVDKKGDVFLIRYLILVTYLLVAPMQEFKKFENEHLYPVSGRQLILRIS